MKQRYIKRQPISDESVQAIAELGISKPLAEALSSRGITAESFPTFFGECFHSPFEMVNMQEAADTLSMILEEGGSVLICGDYDADGLTASSILSLFFTDNGIDNDVIIPTRDEGYGLHADLVFKAFEKKFYDLIITVDCGISNREEVQKIIDELGAEIIVTDHHELPEQLPDCLCVNPKMGYPFPNLAGAGVAWKLVEALAGRETAAKYSDLAMIGTIGDIMPMTDENRSIVKLGLANWQHKSLLKLAELSKCPEKPTASDIAMKITPKINAAGRVGEPETALKLLLSRDKADLAIAKQLLELNEQRKKMVDELVADADALCDAEKIRNQRLVFLHSKVWKHGILGIAAARYKEKYNLPAVVMTENEQEKGVFVGSARGVDGVDLFEVFSSVKDILVKFGGHKASVGFSVKEEDLNELNQRLSQALLALDGSCFEKKLCYDIDLDNGLAVSDMLDFAQKMQPMLPQDKILFRVKDNVKFASSFGASGAHLSATLSSGLEIKGFFKYGAYAPFIKNGAVIEALVSLETDDYTKNICGIIEDMHLCNSVCFDAFYKQNLLKNFVPNVKRIATSKSFVQNVLKGSSVLAVFDDYETYLQVSEAFDLQDYFVDIFFDNSFSGKTVAISPNNDYGFAKYEQVVYFCNETISRTLTDNAVCYPVAAANADLYNLTLNRNLCTDVYSALKHKNNFESIYSVYDKYLLGKMSYEQYLVAIRVFEELGFLKRVDKFTVEFLPTEKKDLTESSIYNCFAEKSDKAVV